MILDSLSNSDFYVSAHPLFSAAFDYLKKFDPATPDGTYELDGKNLFAVVQRYETAPEATRKWEAHRVYADIQCIIAGREKMLHAPVGELVVTAPYNEARDVEKYGDEGVTNVSPLLVPAGTFCVFFPQDGHKPNCMVERPEAILKVVMKVKVAG